MDKLYIVRDPEKRVYLVNATGKADAYRVFALEVWGEEIDDPAKVDVELYPLKKVKSGKVANLFPN